MSRSPQFGWQGDDADEARSCGLAGARPANGPEGFGRWAPIPADEMSSDRRSSHGAPGKANGRGVIGWPEREALGSAKQRSLGGWFGRQAPEGTPEHGPPGTPRRQPDFAAAVHRPVGAIGGRC